MEYEIDFKCSECGSTLNYHIALMHLEKEKTGSTDHGEEIRSTCTAVCRDREGGLFPKQRPEQVCRVYAIVDGQSNASMISPDLVDELGVTGPKEKYFLPTCSSHKEVKYGRCASGLLW